MALLWITELDKPITVKESATDIENSLSISPFIRLTPASSVGQNIQTELFNLNYVWKIR